MKNFHFSDISLSCLLQQLLKNLWMIVAAGLICAMGSSLFLNLFHTDLYQATMTYTVTARRTSFIATNNATAAREVAAVLTEMLQEDIVKNSIRASDEELTDFSGTVSATQVGETNFIQITVQAGSPKDAYLAIKALTGIVPTIAGYVSSGSIVQIIRNPAVSAGPINQADPSDTATKAALLGAAAMAVLLCFLSIQRETIQTRTGARRMLDAPILASVNRENRGRTLKQLLKSPKKPLHVFAPNTSFTFTEQINTICAQLEQANAANGHKTFLIAGTGENEGKSTIAGNVAAALALRGKNVALVDCDLRNPSLNRFFEGKYTSSMPLNKFLGYPFSKDSLLQCMQRHEKLGFYMLFPACADKRCAELISGETMDTLLQQLRVFDIVILDTPPMGYFADAEALADKVDATVLVVRQDYTPACDINDAIDLLRSSRSSFLGCILNDMTASFTEGHGYGYGYGYGYGSKYGYGHKRDRQQKP